MNVCTWIVELEGNSQLPTEPTDLEGALRIAFDLYLEGPPLVALYEFINEEGGVEAVLLRDVENPRIGHVLYADGSIRTYEVTYILHPNGGYSHTEITHVPFALKRRYKPSIGTCWKVLPDNPQQNRKPV